MCECENSIIEVTNIAKFFVQLLGCSAPLFCLVTIGNVVGYSSVLLRQLKNEDSEIQISLSEGSWIGEIKSVFDWIFVLRINRISIQFQHQFQPHQWRLPASLLGY